MSERNENELKESQSRRSSRRMFALLAVGLIATAAAGAYSRYLNRPHPNPIFERIRWCDSATLTVRRFASSEAEHSTFAIADIQPLEYLAFMKPGGDFASRGSYWERVDFQRNGKDVAGAYFKIERNKVHAVFFDAWNEEFEGELSNQSARRLFHWLAAHGHKSFQKSLAKACDRRVRGQEFRRRILEICPWLRRKRPPDASGDVASHLGAKEVERIAKAASSHPEIWELEDQYESDPLLKRLAEILPCQSKGVTEALPNLDANDAAALLFGTISGPDLRGRIPATAFRRAIQKILRHCHARDLYAVLGPLSREHPERVSDVVETELAGRIRQIHRLDGKAEHVLVMGTLAWAQIIGRASISAIRRHLNGVDADNRLILELILMSADNTPERLRSEHLSHAMSWALAQRLLRQRSVEDQREILHSAIHSHAQIRGHLSLCVRMENWLASLAGTDRFKTPMHRLPGEPFRSCPKCVAKQY